MPRANRPDNQEAVAWLTDAVPDGATRYGHPRQRALVLAPRPVQSRKAGLVALLRTARSASRLDRAAEGRMVTFVHPRSAPLVEEPIERESVPGLAKSPSSPKPPDAVAHWTRWYPTDSDRPAKWVGCSSQVGLSRTTGIIADVTHSHRCRSDLTDLPNHLVSAPHRMGRHRLGQIALVVVPDQPNTGLFLFIPPAAGSVGRAVISARVFHLRAQLPSCHGLLSVTLGPPLRRLGLWADARRLVVVLGRSTAAPAAAVRETAPSALASTRQCGTADWRDRPRRHG